MAHDFGRERDREDARDNRPRPDAETLEGRIRRVLFQAPETSYAVLELESPQGQLVSAVGTMPSPMPGETVRLRGTWQVHTRWGRQFRFDDFELLRPATAEGLILYLADTIPGVGRELAQRLVEHFGPRTVEALDEGEQRLREVPGIGPKKAAAIAEAWREHRDIHELMSFLRSVGLSPSLALRVYRAFGPHAVEVVERHPYRLARHVRGVGFSTADRIARRTGLPADDPERIQAGLAHILAEALGEGHLFLPRRTLIERASELLGAAPTRVEHQLEALARDGELVVEEGPDGEQACYVPAMMDCERRVALLLRALAAAKPAAAPRLDQIREWLRRFEAYAQLELNDEQRKALETACGHSVSVITGGPGTGKTLVTRAITWVWERVGKKIALCAPTGRAAKRLEEVTGHEAVTLHRLLGYRPDGTFVHGPDEPLEHDLVVVDEASMVDMPLAASFLSAVSPGTVLVFVGDADQLPPVGPGAFFGEIVRSRALPLVRFAQIYRQAARSLIVANAHRLVRGEALHLPTPDTWQGEDMLWVDVERELDGGGPDEGQFHLPREAAPEEERASLRSQQIALEKVTRAVVRNLPRLGFDAEDIQVLSPMRRGLLGVENLNLRLQELLNPPSAEKPEVRRGQHMLRLGDRVLQTANNYDKGVFNGEIGRVVEIDDGRVTVEFAFGPVEYDTEDLSQLDLAYALTVHKSQGSEYPAVVLVVHSTHYIMLRCNLLYTALTRAERMALLIGNRRGLWRAIRTAPARERRTRLAGRLTGEFDVEPLDLPATYLIAEDDTEL